MKCVNTMATQKPRKTPLITKAIFRVVKCPSTWHCNLCGMQIYFGALCGKMGKKTFCISCIKAETLAINNTGKAG